MKRLGQSAIASLFLATMLLLGHGSASAACNDDWSENCEDNFNGCLDECIDEGGCSLDTVDLCYVLWAPPDFWEEDEPDGPQLIGAYAIEAIDRLPSINRTDQNGDRFGAEWFNTRIESLGQKLTQSGRAFKRSTGMKDSRFNASCEIDGEYVVCRSSSRRGVAALSLKGICLYADGAFSSDKGGGPNANKVTSRHSRPKVVAATCKIPCPTCRLTVD